MLTPTLQWVMARNLPAFKNKLKAINAGEATLESADVVEVPAVEASAAYEGLDTLKLRMSIKKYQISEDVQKHGLALTLVFRGIERNEVSLSEFECLALMDQLPAIAKCMAKIYG